jgi:hypothetical protein
MSRWFLAFLYWAAVLAVSLVLLVLLVLFFESRDQSGISAVAPLFAAL